MTPGSCFCGGKLGVGVYGAHEVARKVGEGLAPAEFTQLSELGGRELALQAGEASRQLGESVGVRAALRDVFEQLWQRG